MFVATLAATCALGACADDNEDSIATTSAPTSPTESAAPTESAETTEPRPSDTTTPDASTDTSTPETASGATLVADDSVPDDEQLVTDRDAFVSLSADASEIPDKALARCLHGALVDALTMDRIVEAGLTPKQFTRASDLEEMGIPVSAVDPDDLQASLASCEGDMAALFLDASWDDAQQRCVRGFLSADVVAAIIVSDLTGAAPADPQRSALDEASQCVQAPTTS